MKTINHFGETYQERVEAAVKSLQEGQGILLVDDEDRENEGDIIFPTVNLTPQNMALMIRECSGIVCLCLKPEKCETLQLPPMVSDNTCKNKTAFTISIEAREGVTTGVSAADRVQTIKTATHQKPKQKIWFIRGTYSLCVHVGEVFLNVADIRKEVLILSALQDWEILPYYAN